MNGMKTDILTLKTRKFDIIYKTIVFSLWTTGCTRLIAPREWNQMR
jgi:hypothetical protein